MFENYSFGDLLSNIYKKRILNLIAFLLLSIALVCPLVLQTINKKTITKEGVQYSTYVAYKITAPESDNINALYSRRGYSDFYEKLLVSNLNGAYLFNDVSDKDLSKMAKELDTSAVTLKNSNADYWDKKVVVNYISTNLGVSAKILTPSKAVNDVIEKKFDELINKYKSVYKNVTIEKVESNYSKELSSKENVNTGYSMKKLLVKVFAIEVALIILVAIMNFVMYIFNPTINREGDYRKYNIKFVQEIKNNNDLLEVLKYKINNENIEELSILSSNSKIIDKLNDLNIDKVNIVKTNDLGNIMNLKNVILVVPGPAARTRPSPCRTWWGGTMWITTGKTDRCLRKSRTPPPRECPAFSVVRVPYYSIVPSPPISAVISRIRSRGNGGSQRGFIAMDISFIGLSSAATRLESSFPQRRQRWTMAHSPPFRTQTATGSISPPQSDALSPGSSSTCRLHRQFGQWLRWALPAPSGTTMRPQFLQVNTSLQACVL